MEEDSGQRKPIGCDPNSSLLYAQVISGEPKMVRDNEGFLRTMNWNNKKNNQINSRKKKKKKKKKKN